MSNDPHTPAHGDLKAGTRLKEIAGFEIIGKLGQGGMGAVFKARQKSLDRIVALKILPPSIAKDAVFIERFQREARASARLNHPHIVQGIDVGKDAATNLWYFAMEYVDGPSLKKVLEDQRIIPEARALVIMKEVASALETIGAHQMVHRDIKPDNILLTANGQTKLADLGLAKQLNEDSNLTQSGQAVGTPYYMAPEQVRGKFDECDIRTDIYSLGATFFHIVTGRTPYEGETSAVIMAKHLTDAPPKASKINPAVSEACSKLIEKMMQKKTEQRVQSPAELIVQIDKILKVGLPGMAPGVSKTAARTPIPERKRESAPAKKSAVMAYAGGGVVLIVALVFALKGGAATKPALIENNQAAMEHAKTSLAKVPVPPAVSAAAAEELFKAAVEFEQKTPDEFNDITQRYQRAALAARGSSQGAEIQDKVEDALEALQTRQRAAADNAWNTAEEKSAELAARGHYDEALALYQAVMPKLAPPQKAKANEKIRCLHQEAEAKISAITRKVEDFAKDAEPREGIAALAEAEKLTYEPTRGLVATLKKKLTEDLANEAELKKKKALVGALKKLFEVIQKFDAALLEKNDPKAALQIAKDAKKDAELKPLETYVSAMNDVMEAYDDPAQFEQDIMIRLIGQKIELETISGIQKGKVIKVQDSAIALEMADAGFVAVKTIKIATLTEAQRKKLFPPYVPQTDAQRIALCYSRLVKGTQDYKGALALIELAPLFPLAAHCRQLANKARETQENAMAEAAAPVLWAEINTRASQAKFAEADVKTLRERVGRFDKEFGKTQFAATNKDKLDAVKAKIIKLTATNMVVNGDFESGTFDGWKKTGGTNSGKITTDFGHGKYSLIGHIQPDYNTTLTQALTLEPQAEYRVSCWIRHGRGSLDMAANSGLYIIEGEGDRRDEDTHRIRFAPKARVNEWVQVEMHFTPQVANCRVEVFMRQRSKADDHYIMYLDDVEVVRVLK